jgi:hypothetical protein
MRGHAGYLTQSRHKHKDLLAIQRVLEEAGVIFLDPGEHLEGGVGVRLKPLEPQRRRRS